MQGISVTQNFDAVNLDAFLAQIVVHQPHRVVFQVAGSVLTLVRWRCLHLPRRRSECRAGELSVRARSV